MRYVTIGSYQFSAVFLIIVAVAIPLACAATYYVWSSKTVPFSVEEPLSVVYFPDSIHFRPGENSTIDITIANSANINYAIVLDITLSDSSYQQSYVQVSNSTYTILPGNNNISPWIAVGKDAPPSQQQITVNFLRQ
jgi:uncharacterized membrane protein